ncbi:O-antigen ligase family protein [Mycolicibacterium sp. GCM10028919]|uniref:O-antigen ligase family protein n=1 Tax=Mycolicibacterium sp. GCM10028919 TaxID=3273401 RepID=UPI00361FA998
MWTELAGVLIAALSALLLVIAFWHHPRFALVAWLLSLAMVPVWFSVDFVVSVPAHSVIAVLAIASTVSRTRPTVTKYDYYFATFITISFAAVLFGGSSAGLWSEIVLQWAVPFVAARVLIAAAGVQFSIDAIATILSVVAILAIIEFLFQWHPFVNLNSMSLQFEYWHAIQIRDGTDRSEWAFGHSIALGGSLALSIPFIIRSSFSSAIKIAMLVCVGAGIVTTASRGALIAAGLTAVICMVYVSKARILRTATLSISLIVGVVATSALGRLVQTWTRGGSKEEQWSYDHRDDLYTTYLPAIEWFGKSPIYRTDGSGYYSTDSALLRIGLQFGWIVLLLAVIALASIAFRVIAGRASTPEIALVGQLPLFTTVALITQYQSMIFIVAGFAVHMASAREQSLDSALASAGHSLDPAHTARGPIEKLAKRPHRLHRMASPGRRSLHALPARGTGVS